MASLGPTSQPSEAIVPFWAHFDLIFHLSSLLHTKLATNATRTSKQIKAINKIHARLLTAITDVGPDLNFCSNQLSAQLDALNVTLPTYVFELSALLPEEATATAGSSGDDNQVNNAGTAAAAQLATTRTNLLANLSAIIAEFPPPNEQRAWDILHDSLTTLRTWTRRRVLQAELAHLRRTAHNPRRSSKPYVAAPRLGEILRELNSLPATLAHAAPELREMILQWEAEDVAARGAAAHKALAVEDAKLRGEAMELVTRLMGRFRPEELRNALEAARARESAVHSGVKGTEVQLGAKAAGLSKTAWGILQRFVFGDFSVTKKDEIGPPMSWCEVQEGTSDNFLMRGLRCASMEEVCHNRAALRELVDAALLTEEVSATGIKHYTAPASTTLALRWRLIVTSQQPPTSNRHACVHALLDAASDLRRTCKGLHHDWVPTETALEALRHARALLEVPKASWMKLERYEKARSWPFVAHLVAEIEATVEESGTKDPGQALALRCIQKEVN